MSVTTTFGQLVEAAPALSRLAAEKLPFQTAYSVAKLAKVVQEELQHFTEQRNALVREHGAAKADGAPGDIQVTPSMASWPTFAKQASELLAVTVPLAVGPIDLTAVTGLTITAEDLLLLGSLVTVEAA
jgi:hypothetical protein